MIFLTFIELSTSFFSNKSKNELKSMKKKKRIRACFFNYKQQYQSDDEDYDTRIIL